MNTTPNRIAATFAALQAKGRKALIPYVTAGFPFADITPALMHGMVEAGADIIELGVPFSDPMADGPVIQQAGERALTRGIGLLQVLQAVRQFRQRDDRTPVVLMGYANPVERYDQRHGAGAFIAAAAAAGVDGVLVVDYPPEECAGFADAMKQAGIDPNSNLPWQIAVDGQGGSTVFGLQPGVSTLGEVRQRLGNEIEVAIIAEPNEIGTLEGYYAQVPLGFVLAKMVVTVDVSDAAISAMRERALRAKHMESTTRRITLHPDDLAAADQLPIRAISVIPASNIDEATIVQRFGEPGERIAVSERRTHLLYPKLGLDVVVDKDGKELLQYVAPRHFDLLLAPLQAEVAARAAAPSAARVGDPRQTLRGVGGPARGPVLRLVRDVPALGRLGARAPRRRSLARDPPRRSSRWTPGCARGLETRCSGPDRRRWSRCAGNQCLDLCRAL